MSNKIIFRVQKLKSTIELKRSLMHAMREQDTPNADSSKFHDNQFLGINCGMNFNVHELPEELQTDGQIYVNDINDPRMIGKATVNDCMTEYQNLMPSKVRKNAVHCLEFIVSGSKEQMDKMTKQERYDFFKNSLEFIANKTGGIKNVIHAQIHNDEITPHLTLFIVPIDEKGKLNARKFVGGSKNEMRKWQTEIAEVGKKYGLERGIAKSRPDKHTTVRTYYTVLNQIKDYLQSEKNVSDELLNKLARDFTYITNKTANDDDISEIKKELLRLKVTGLFSGNQDKRELLTKHKEILTKANVTAEALLKPFLDEINSKKNEPDEHLPPEKMLECFLNVLRPRLEMDNEKAKKRRKKELEALEAEKKALSEDRLAFENKLEKAIQQERKELKLKYDLHNKNTLASEIARYKAEINTKYNELVNDYNELSRSYNKLLDDYNKQQAKNQELRTENSHLESKLNELKQTENNNKYLRERNAELKLYEKHWTDIYELKKQIAKLEEQQQLNMMNSNRRSNRPS